MIPLPFWLTNIQFVISAFGAFAFFSAAWLNIDSWAVRKEVKTGFRALGFILLAIWSGLHGIALVGTATDITTAAILFSGTFLILLSFIFNKPPLQPKDLVKLQRQERNIVSKSKEAPIKKEIVPTTPPRPLPAKQAKAAIKAIAATQTVPGTDAKLKTSPFVELPKKKRQIITSLLNTIVGFIIFGLIGWGGYVAYQKFFNTPEDSNIYFEESDFSEIDVTTPPPEATSSEEETEEDKKQEEETTEASPTPQKTTITVQETGIGYLNVRSGAGTTNEIITKISPGDTLELLGEEEKWYEVQVDEDTTGWISSQYATINE
jgi:hypothetical protein